MVKKAFGIELIKGEKVVDFFRQSIWPYLIHYLISLGITGTCAYLFYYNLYVETILLIVGMVIGTIVFLITLIINKSNLTIITNERVIYKTGIFNFDAIDVDIDKIQNTRVEQNLIQRFFGYGTLSLDTSGSSGFEAVMKGVPNIQHWRARIKGVMEGTYDKEEELPKKHAQVIEAKKRKKSMKERREIELENKKNFYNKLKKIK